MAARPHRNLRSHRALPPAAGQCFEITIAVDAGRWLVRIPEIDCDTEAERRSEVELVARRCIAAHTGIPIGYISVWVRD